MLALLALVGFGAGFVDAIAGGGGLLTLPSLALAGLDPVTAVATNKLASTFGSGSATLAFWRSGKIERAMAPSALAAGAGAALGALALPYAPRALLSEALPVVLIAVALYFAFAPNSGEAQRHARLSPAVYAATIAPTIGFYDGVFGSGAGSFYMIGFVVFAGFGLIRAMAGAIRQFRQQHRFSDDLRRLGTYPRGCGTGDGRRRVSGARLGARTAIRAGARLVRPLIVAISCAMALKLMSAPGGLWPPAGSSRPAVDAFDGNSL